VENEGLNCRGGKRGKRLYGQPHGTFSVAVQVQHTALRSATHTTHKSVDVHTEEVQYRTSRVRDRLAFTEIIGAGRRPKVCGPERERGAEGAEGSTPKVSTVEIETPKASRG